MLYNTFIVIILYVFRATVCAHHQEVELY